MPVSIHGKQYATVNERVTEAHEQFPGRISVTTEILQSTSDDVIRVKATLTVKEYIESIVSSENHFTGHAEEIIGSSMINKTSALENAETSAVGRALAFAGFSTDASIASADEVANAIINQDQGGQNPPSEKQKKYLYSLMAEKLDKDQKEEIIISAKACKSAWEMSILIDKVKNI